MVLLPLQHRMIFRIKRHQQHTYSVVVYNCTALGNTHFINIGGTKQQLHLCHCSKQYQPVTEQNRNWKLMSKQLVQKQAKDLDWTGKLCTQVFTREKNPMTLLGVLKLTKRAVVWVQQNTNISTVKYS